MFCVTDSATTPPPPLPLRLSYPGGGGKHVLVSELEAVHLLQNHSAVLLALEEVGAAEYSGHTQGLLPLDQHCGGGVVGLHTPGGHGEEKQRRWIGEEEVG